MAFWLLRFWLAARAIGTGLTKFIGKVEGEIPNPEFEAKIKECSKCANNCEVVRIYKEEKLIDSWGNRCENGLK